MILIGRGLDLREREKGEGKREKGSDERVGRLADRRNENRMPRPGPWVSGFVRTNKKKQSS